MVGVSGEVRVRADRVGVEEKQSEKKREGRKGRGSR